jgi:hypothetical protein
MRKITLTDMGIDILVSASTMVLLYQVHINLIYVTIIHLVYKTYIFVDTYMQMRRNAQNIAEMVKKFGMEDLGGGMYISTVKRDENVQSDASSDKPEV